MSRTRFALACLFILACAPHAGAASEDPGSAEKMSLSRDLRVVVRGGARLELHVLPNDDDAPGDVARRVAGSRDAPGAPDREGWLAWPVEALDGDHRGLVLRSLFPRDRFDDDGDYLHHARAGRLPTYDEGLWQVAAWFTGRGDHFAELMRANGLDSPELREGQVVRIPRKLLHASIRPRARSSDGLLEYGSDPEGDFATYRLARGEALYSSVVLRFTGRTGAEDVREVAAEIAGRSGVRDLRDIPVGFPIKIPFSLLLTDYLPDAHPRRLEAEAKRRELEEALAEAPLPGNRAGLEGVLVILDAGHGGRDLGTVQHGIWEHDYVYDVACRLKRKLEQTTRASVHMTLMDEETGCEVAPQDRLVANYQGSIQTHPPFLAERQGQAKMGVNLRWYLANSVYKKAVADGYDPDRIVFLSLHADSRHPGLRGVMVYVPGADYRTKTYGHSSPTYRKYREVREKTHVSFSRKHRVRSEAVSRKLADRIVHAFGDLGLPVHPYEPVRDKVIRGKGKWVPAVLKANAVPTQCLVEMVNLSNKDDAELLAAGGWRERLADAILRSLHLHYGEDPARIAAVRPGPA